MNFQLTEEHLSVQQAARDFAQTELLPGVIERDTHQKFPAEQIKRMGELGFMGMMVDPALQWWWNGFNILCAGHGRNFKGRCFCFCLHVC